MNRIKVNAKNTKVTMHNQTIGLFSPVSTPCQCIHSLSMAKSLLLRHRINTEQNILYLSLPASKNFQISPIKGTPINLILKIFRDEATNTSPDNLFQYFTIFTIKNVFIFVLGIFVMNFKVFPILKQMTNF